MTLNCPLCHGHYSIEALTQDEAARELLRLRPTMLPSLLPYLTLFRSGKRSLAFDKALKLATEVMALDVEPARLEAAMAETVQALRAKEQREPLKNHNYLKKVLKSVGPAEQFPVATRQPAPDAPTSRTAKGISRLENWKQG